MLVDICIDLFESIELCFDYIRFSAACILFFFFFFRIVDTEDMEFKADVI